MRWNEKLKSKDEYCTRFVLKQIDTVKKYFNISSSQRVYALDWWYDRYYYLCGNKVYAVHFEYINKDPYKPTVNSAYVITLKNNTIANFETIKPDDTTPRFEEFNSIKRDKTRKILTEELFKLWYYSPVQVNEYVDVTHKEAIEFLQNYKKNTFKTDRYLFFVKRDDDLTWLYFIYAYDLKAKAELKIYVDSYITTDFPEKLSEIYVKDLSGKLSKTQILQCKKAFYEYCKSKCEELNAPNFYALEFVKQCIQPIEKDRGWCITRPICEDFELGEIWLDDNLMYDEKPYFLISNKNRTKIAVLDFYKSEYKSTEPYISGYMKRNHWNMDKETLEKLVKLLNKQYDYKNTVYFKQCGKIYMPDGKYTNWQMLIDSYNNDIAEQNDYVKLSLNLPIPDYTKLR